MHSRPEQRNSHRVSGCGLRCGLGLAAGSDPVSEQFASTVSALNLGKRCRGI